MLESASNVNFDNTVNLPIKEDERETLHVALNSNVKSQLWKADFYIKNMLVYNVWRKKCCSRIAISQKVSKETQANTESEGALQLEITKNTNRHVFPKVANSLWPYTIAGLKV